MDGLRRSPSTDAQGLDVAGPTRSREKLLDDLLSLGRNWALAIAIAGAGAAVHYSESVYEAGLWRGLLPTLCFLVAVIWIVLSIIRFDLTLQQHVERRRSRWLSRLLYVVLLGTGITAVFFVTELAASNHIARMCDSVASEPASRIHRSAECQRLYQHRAAYRQRLESAGAEFD
ncbi:hypothetical protein JY452_01070 [Stenotrophomonas maltophilia]|nr:hypothetical protein D1178_15465 [Stenotrophomonas maltophilia]WGS58597.1 hypothetical protein IAI57_07500 [Stenotrophomonas pavanii]KOO79436.1 membrane protein [Stenotrophomonas maltophilia]MBN5124597.1 hypothetical protein [Stenotrophomonas maltophilia]MBN5175401.1 hypothetical protein [Stenotrophomonas maltophilia]